MCRKVVEYGVMCECCAAWFHATEQCCGDMLENAFVKAGRDSWCCINCFPLQGEAPPADPLKRPIAAIDHLDWRRAFRILTDSCSGCGLKVTPSATALRCSSCDLAYHANCRCTGVPEEEVARTLERKDWRCPTCMVHATGGAIEGAVVRDDVSSCGHEGGQEEFPIPLLNEVDGEKCVQNGDFEYARHVVWRHPRVLEQKTTLPLADWGGRCIHNEATSWLPATIESGGLPIKREVGPGGSAYNSEGCLLFARDHIFECNASCSCGPDCANRVVGRGVKAPLQVVKTIGRGWGVRSRARLPAGSFVCEYTGNILLDTDADTAGLEVGRRAPPRRRRRCLAPRAPRPPSRPLARAPPHPARRRPLPGLQVDDSYLFNLDGEEKGQVSKRRRTGTASSSAAAQSMRNPELAVDAGRIGSVARFLNHCCEPNLFVQSVFIEYSSRVHRIALFAARDILPYEELTYDYGYVVGSVEGKTLRCLCGAPSCRGYLF